MSQSMGTAASWATTRTEEETGAEAESGNLVQCLRLVLQNVQRHFHGRQGKTADGVKENMAESWERE